MTHSTAVNATCAGDAPSQSVDRAEPTRRVGRSGRSRRGVDIPGLERQLKEAFASLAGDRPFARPWHGDLLTHDQARILRLLFVCGPQAAIETRARQWRPGGRTAPRVATAVGREAGCQDPSSVGAAIAELCAAGLMTFSREPLRDRRRYRLIEDEPNDAGTSPGAAAPEQLRGTLRLTPLGETLCRHNSMLYESALAGGRTSGRFSKAAAREAARAGSALIGRSPEMLI